MNESTDVLQLYELSRLCDGTPDCYRGSDELRRELKCTSKYCNKLQDVYILYKTTLLWENQEIHQLLLKDDVPFRR